MAQYLASRTVFDAVTHAAAVVRTHAAMNVLETAILAGAQLIFVSLTSCDRSQPARKAKSPAVGARLISGLFRAFHDEWAAFSCHSGGVELHKDQEAALGVAPRARA